MKRTLFFLILSLSLIMSFFATAQAAGDSPIKIGITEDVSGYNADGGRAERDAGILCIEEWNKKGGINGQKIEYIFRDNGGDPTKASTIAKEFVNSGVTGVLGATSTTVGLGENKVFTPAQIPYVMCSMSKKFWDLRGPDGKWYAFTAVGSEPVLAGGWIETLINHVPVHKKVAILHVNILWGKSLNDTIKELLKTKYAAAGVEVVGSVEVELRPTDLSRQVAQVRALKPDAVISVMFPDAYVAWFRACQLLDYHPPIIAYWGLSESVYISVDPKLLYNLYGYGSYDGGKKIAVDTLARLKKRFGYTPVSHWAAAWDAMDILLKGIKNAGTNGPAIRDWIATKSTGIDILSGNKNAVCRIEDGSPYYYSILYPENFGIVYVDKDGKKIWKD